MKLRVTIFAALLVSLGLTPACSAWPALTAALLGVSSGAGSGGLFFLPPASNDPIASVPASDAPGEQPIDSGLQIGVAASSGYYRAGAAFTFSLRFSEAVNVSGAPRLALNNGAIAHYASGAGGDTLLFTYEAQSGDDVAALDYTDPGAIDLNGGAIRFAGDDSAPALTLPAPGAAGSISAAKSITIDTIAPEVASIRTTAASGTYGAGDTIDIIVQFDESVTATDGAELALGVNPARSASYLNGASSAEWTFRYTIQSGDEANGLDYASAAALSGDFVDRAGNAASRTLPAPGANGSISAARTLVIDTTEPVVSFSGASSSGEESVTNPGIVVRLNKAATSAVTVNYSVSGGAASVADYANGSGTLSFAAGETSATLPLTIEDDESDEASETIIIELDGASGASAGSQQSFTYTILDNDAPPVITLAVAPSNFSENTGETTLTASASVASGKTITVNLSYSGDARQTDDYTGVGSITIAAGANDGSIVLRGVNDSVYEGTETATVAIASVVNGTESGAQSVDALVTDDDLGLLAAETLDADQNGKIDHYRLTFSGSAVDSSFPGYAANALGAAQSEWLVSGYTNVRLAHGAAAPESDTVNDATLYIKFDENESYDTGAKPDVTTGATPGVENAAGDELDELNSAGVTEADRARPVIVSASGAAGSAELTVVFSEAVYGASGVIACGSGGELFPAALSYADENGTGASDLSLMGADDCASDAGRTAVFLADAAFVAADNNRDSVAPAAALYDAANNTGANVRQRLSITAGPVLQAAYQYDSNHNGVIDQIRLVFSVNMDDATIDDADAARFTINGFAAAAVDAGSGGAGAINAPNPDPGAANDATITIFTDDVRGGGTDAAAISFTKQSGRWLGNSIELESISSLSSVLVDAAPPVLLTAIASDGVSAQVGVDADDRMVLTFSEPTNKPAITGANIDSVFPLSGGHLWGGITSATWSADGSQLTIAFSGSGSTIAAGDRITIASGIFDVAAAPNESVNIPAYNAVSGDFSVDNTPPYLVTVSNVTPQSITLRFSEAMRMDSTANAANTLANYALVEDPANPACNDVTLASLTVIAQDTILLTLSENQSLCSISYRITAASNLADLAGNTLVSPRFLTFTGNEQLRLISATSLSTTQIRLAFNKALQADVDVSGSAGCSGASECASRYKISPSLGSITSAVAGSGALANTVTLTTSGAQTGVLYTVIGANGANGDGFDNSGWGAIRAANESEALQAAPGDRATLQGAGVPVDSFDDGALFSDPFGDGSIFSYIFKHGGRVYVGTNDINTVAFRFEPDGSNAVTVNFGFSSGTCPGANGFGYGSTPVCGTNSGPNGERGIVGFTSAVATISSVAYDLLLAGPLKDNVSNGYITQDLDLLLNWAAFALGSYTGGSNTKSAQTVYAVDDHLYVAMSSAHNTQAPIVTRHALTASGGVVSVGIGTDLNIRSVNGLGQAATGGGSYDNPAPAGQTVGIDSMIKYNGRLYMANNGGVFYSSNLATFGSPVDVTPSSFGTAAGSATLVLPATPAGLEKLGPGQRGIPILREYGGNLYMARNVASGAVTNTTTNKVNLRGELWRCANPCSAASDWTRLISGTESDLNGATAISMFEINGASALYVGFNNTAGISVYRLVSSNPPATNGSTLSSAGWVQQGVNGLNVSYTRILSSTTISANGKHYIYLVAGTGSDAIKLFRQID